MSRRHRTTSSIQTWIWGLHVVKEALDSPWTIVDRISVMDERSDRFREILQYAKKKGISIQIESRATLAKRLQDASQHQGIAASIRMEPSDSMDEAIDKHSLSLPFWSLALDQVEDPRNLGAILRSAHFFGAKLVLMPRDHCAPLSGTVAKASAGALFSIPVVIVTNLAREMQRAQDLDFWRVGLDASSNRTLSEAIPAKRSTMLVLGSEGKGLRPLTAKRCDELARLSVSGHRDSLNVSVAAGVACYEVAQKQA